MKYKTYTVNELAKILGGVIEAVWTRDGKHEVGIGGECTIQILVREKKKTQINGPK